MQKVSRTLVGIGAIAAALSLSACGNQASNQASSQTTSAAKSPASSTSSTTGTAKSGHRPSVVTTFTILEDMTKTIAGDAVEVHSLTKPGDEIHGFDPTPATMKDAAQADMIIANGLGLEHWADKLYEKSKATRVIASTGVTPINIEGTNNPNPHAWMSPKNAEIYVTNITNALKQAYPDHAAEFTKNAEKYRNEIHSVGENLENNLKKLPESQRALVSCEGAFSYLAKDAGMSEGYIWPVNAEGDITPSQIQSAIRFVKEHHVPATFCESTVETGPQEQVLKATGAHNGGTLFVDSLTDEKGEAPTYLDLLKYDTTTIINGLTK